MKNPTLILAVAILAAGASSVQAAPIIIDATASKPTIGADDVSSYVSNGVSNNNSDDYTNNAYPDLGDGAPGQTFTVTTSGDLTAITVQGSGNADDGAYQANTYALYVYSVNGTSLTELGGADTYQFADQTGHTNYDTDYLTFDLPTAVSVTAGQVYAFSLGQIENVNVWYGLAGSTSDVYTGGTAIVSNNYPSASTAINSPTLNYDRNFDAQIVDAPEPTIWAMLACGLASLVALQRRRKLS